MKQFCCKSVSVCLACRSNTNGKAIVKLKVTLIMSFYYDHSPVSEPINLEFDREVAKPPQQLLSGDCARHIPELDRTVALNKGVKDKNG